MAVKKSKKRRKLTILARIIGTCLLAFGSGLTLFLVTYLFTQKFFWIEQLEQFVYSSHSTVMNAQSSMDEYSVLEKITFPEVMGIEIGRAEYRDMDTRANYLLTMKDTFGNEGRISFSGVNKLIDTAHRNGEVLILSDEFNSYHLALKTAPCFYPNATFLQLRKKNSWIKKADPNYPYKDDGFFMQEETEHGYQVVFAVEGEKDTGYLKLEYDLEENQLNRFLYLENKAVYSDMRAKETILSATGCVSDLTQKEMLVLELDDMPETFDIDMVVDGHPYEQMQCSWKYSEILRETGTYLTIVKMQGVEYLHEVKVCDSRAPEYRKNEYIFFEGDKIDEEWIAKNCFEDVSMPVTVSFVDPEQAEYIVSDEVKNGIFNVSVLATDAEGNSAEFDVPLVVYDNKDLPEWFRFFMDYEDEELLQRVRMGELDGIKAEYFKTYQEDHWNEIYDEAVAGYKTAIRKDLDIRIEGNEWYGYRLMEIYAGINDIPEHLLDSYIENEWQINLYDGELLLGDMECAGITHYLDQKIDLTSYYDVPYSFRATILHEFGHYVDYYYDFNVRSDGELYEYMEWLRSDYGLTEEFLTEWYSEGCVGEPYSYERGDYRQYSMVYVEEFFADSFFFYCAYPEKLNKEYPHIYNKVEEVVEAK